MSNEKIKVTVQDGAEVREYEGDLIHLNVFNCIGDDMEMNSEIIGSNFIPTCVVDGAMESVLQMMANLSRTPEAERRLLGIADEKLVERMEKLDKSKYENALLILYGSDIKDFPRSIFKDKEVSR